MCVGIKERREFAFCFIDCQHFRERTKEKEKKTCVRKHTSSWFSQELCICPCCRFWCLFASAKCGWWDVRVARRRWQQQTVGAFRSYMYIETYNFIESVFRSINKLMQSPLTIKCHNLQPNDIMTTIQWLYFEYYIFDIFFWNIYIRIYELRMV